MKLMEKTAEKRYQSALGIRKNLAECLQQLQTTGNILEFPLGTQDISEQFQIPQKLYGREAEVEALLTAFERVADLSTYYSGANPSYLFNNREHHPPTSP